MFTGTGTALVTPFSSNGTLDKTSFVNLIEQQIEAGIDFIVPCGTTGESPTLIHSEHRRVIKIAGETARGTKTCVVAGTGSNSTAEAVELTRYAKRVGADGALVVAPYYNKPSQEGIYAYYQALSKIGIPIIVYNIPGRCGVNIEPRTMAAICRLPNIVGIKQATGQVDRVTTDLEMCPKHIVHLSGDDDLTAPMIYAGAHGVISVLSNIMPAEVVQLVSAARVGNHELADTLRSKYKNLTQALFAEGNPAGVKAAMAMMGQIDPFIRSPLVMPTQSTLDRIRYELRQLGLNADQYVTSTEPIPSR